MSNLYSTPVSTGTSGHGLAWQHVIVRSVDAPTRTAVCVNQHGNELVIRMDMMRSKGLAPEVGERWIIEKPYGVWMFGAVLTGPTDGVNYEKVTGLPAVLEDKQSQIDTTNQTVAQNFLLRPTGDIEPTIRTTPKANTLLLQGQQVSRTTYASLWTFAQQQGLVTAGLFTSGDGSTTFGLPDFRGRVPVGAGVLGADSYNVGSLVGAARVTLATNQMPAHNHSVSVVNDGTHAHNVAGTTDPAGNHAPHPSYQIPVAAGSGANDVWAGPEHDPGDHTHGWHGTSSDQGDHTHGINQSTVGGTTPVDLRQPSIGVNWLVWT